MWREPKPSRIFTSSGKGGSDGKIVGEPRARARDAVLLEEEVGEVLVAHRRADLGRRSEHERGGERGAVRARGSPWSRSVSGTTSSTSWLVDERRKRSDVAGVVDAGNERLVIGVVERRREAIGVRGDGDRARTGERGHDVDALPRAGEENGCHGGRG